MGVAVKKKVNFFLKIDMYILQIMFWLLRGVKSCKLFLLQVVTRQFCPRDFFLFYLGLKPEFFDL